MYEAQQLGELTWVSITQVPTWHMPVQGNTTAAAAAFAAGPLPLPPKLNETVVTFLSLYLSLSVCKLIQRLLLSLSF